jgi:hypothetical protein
MKRYCILCLQLLYKLYSCLFCMLYNIFGYKFFWAGPTYHNTFINSFEAHEHLLIKWSITGWPSNRLQGDQVISYRVAKWSNTGSPNDSL